jgi:hypothetical protein
MIQYCSFVHASTHIAARVLASRKIIEVHVDRTAIGNRCLGVDLESLADGVRHQGKSLAELIDETERELVVMDGSTDQKDSRSLCRFIVLGQQGGAAETALAGMLVVRKFKQMGCGGGNTPHEPGAQHRSMWRGCCPPRPVVRLEPHSRGLARARALGHRSPSATTRHGRRSHLLSPRLPSRRAPRGGVQTAVALARSSGP